MIIERLKFGDKYMKLQINESQNIEFKQTWKDEYLKTICAFANTDGGKLYIGVDDDGNIIGVEDTILLVETLPNKINNRLGIIADVIAKSSEDKSYIEVAVQKTFAPISYGGKFYQRSGSNTIELNGSNLTNFLLKRFGKTWDDVIEERFSIEEINLETIKKFKPKLAICIYHKLEDFYEIPMFIDSLGVEYDMYFDYYTPVGWEMVLYCVPKIRISLK